MVLARNLGWHKLVNGDLLRSADSAGFDFLVTVDKQMRHQSSLKGIRLGVVILDVEANSHSAVESALIELNGLLHEFDLGKFHLFRPS